jgi:hypothetical protein
MVVERSLNAISTLLNGRFNAAAYVLPLGYIFARGPAGDVNVFQNAAGVSINSTWKRIEFPILQNNNIIYNTVK